MVNCLYLGDTLTVGELMEKLSAFPKDMPIGDECSGITTVELHVIEDSNYPYNRPNLEYVRIF